MVDVNDDDDDDDDNGGGNANRNRRRDGQRGRRDNNRGNRDGQGRNAQPRGNRDNARPRDNRPPRDKPEGGVAQGAVAAVAAAAAGGSDRGDDSYLGSAADAIGAFGARKVGGALARMIPEEAMSRLRGIPGGRYIPPAVSVVSAVGMRAVGFPPAVRRLATDAAVDFAVGLSERVTGEPVSEEGKKAAKSAKDSVEKRLAEARGFQFVVVEGGTEYHHPRCHQLPHPKTRGVKTFMMTAEEAELMTPPVDPAPCCGQLISKQIESSKKLEQEVRKMAEGTRPKSAAELLATPDGQKIMSYVHELYDVDERPVIVAFLVEHLDEGEVALLAADGLTREQFALRLQAIKNRREQTSVEATLGKAKEGFGRVKDAIGMAAPLNQASAQLEGAANTIWGAAFAKIAGLGNNGNNNPGGGQP